MLSRENRGRLSHRSKASAARRHSLLDYSQLQPAHTARCVCVNLLNLRRSRKLTECPGIGQESAQANDPIEIFESFEQQAAVPRHFWTMGGSPLNIGGSSGGLNRGRGFASTSAWFHRDTGYNFGGPEDAKSEVRHKRANNGEATAQRAPSSKYKRPMTSDNAVVQ